MTNSPRNLFVLSTDLPVPTDDGACDHLTGMKLPPLVLLSTKGRNINLRDTAQAPAVFFFYPKTGRPEDPTPADWDLIPGARGCTPQSCGFRDRFAEFEHLGVKVFGISTQSTEYQQEFAERVQIPFEILSDEKFHLTEALRLPTFIYNSKRLIKRLAFFAEQGRIHKVFYPVFPPDRNASMVFDWLRTSGMGQTNEVGACE